jgi:hypothetical protein
MSVFSQKSSGHPTFAGLSIGFWQFFGQNACHVPISALRKADKPKFRAISIQKCVKSGTLRILGCPSGTLRQTAIFAVM